MADSSDSEGGGRLGIPQAVPEIGREANVARPKRVSAPAKLFARLPALGYGGHGERPRTFKPKGSWHAVIQHDKPPWLFQHCHGAPRMVAAFADAPFRSPGLRNFWSKGGKFAWAGPLANVRRCNLRNA